MSKFETGLQAARKKQIAVYLLLAIVVIAGGAGLFGTLMVSSGTAIEIRPDDARATGSVEIASGLAVSVGTVVYALSDQPRIRVSAPGFFTTDRLISPEEKGKVVRVTLTDRPGELRVSTTPSTGDTKWYIDDRLTETGAHLEQSLIPGHYVVRIDNPFHDVQEIEALITRAERTDVSVNLKPVSGFIDIDTAPVGGTVTIDGVLKGEAPVRLPLVGGEYDIRVSHPGFETIRETVRITNDHAGIIRNYRLQPLQGELSFSVRPTGGDLLVNGKKIDPATPLPVPAGSETVISYSHPGFYSSTEEIVLRAGESRDVSISLTPEFGAVRVEAQPQASVLVDGVMVGSTPLNMDLPAVAVTITVQRQGYRSVTKRITPTGKSDTVISEVLQLESVARLAEAPRVYKTSVESGMMLFEPTRFTMGAPRHEQGQRANEFVRDVDLTLPFYAGMHEITSGQFRTFMPDHSGSSLPDEPVTSVSWEKAAQFCNWLSIREKLEPFYILDGSEYRGINENANGYRLLTEAEWEWLARRAAKTQQTMFTWGDETTIPKNAGNIADETARGGVRFYVPNYNDGNDIVAPVGSYPAEPSGLYDQTGNVSEWVHDYYSLQPPPPDRLETNPFGPSYGDVHVVKGSNWQSGTRTTLRAAYREGSPDGGPAVGFRIARYLYGGRDVE